MIDMSKSAFTPPHLRAWAFPGERIVVRLNSMMHTNDRRALAATLSEEFGCPVIVVCANVSGVDVHRR